MLALTSVLDELEKLGFISDEQARRSLDQLDQLEKSKPTGGQVARYAGLGALAGPAIGALGQAVKGGRPTGVSMLGHLAGARTPGTGDALRSVASNAVTGALTGGAVPLARGALDRQANISHLKKYLQQEPTTEGSTGV
jgi:hypothetical protein